MCFAFRIAIRKRREYSGWSVSNQINIKFVYRSNLWFFPHRDFDIKTVACGTEAYLDKHNTHGEGTVLQQLHGWNEPLLDQRQFGPSWCSCSFHSKELTQKNNLFTIPRKEVIYFRHPEPWLLPPAKKALRFFSQLRAFILTRFSFWNCFSMLMLFVERADVKWKPDIQVPCLYFDLGAAVLCGGFSQLFRLLLIWKDRDKSMQWHRSRCWRAVL